MRQHLGEKKLQRLRTSTGLDIRSALVRGGTGHRIDLLLVDGSIVNLWPDGSRTPSEMRWTPPSTVLENGCAL